MIQLVANNAATTLAVGISNAATSLTLTSVVGFPVPTGGDYFMLTLVGLNANGQESTWEVVKCTAVAGSVLTVLRAQEGTTAQAWGVNTRTEIRLTANFAQAAMNHLVNTGNPHSVTKAHVSLGNADNTSDADKPVSTAQQAALNLKAALASPTFTGAPTAPTAAPGTNTTQLATTAFVLANTADYYGLSWNESTDVYTRTGSATGAINLPVQAGMRRCLLNDAGVVTGYLHPLDSNYLDTGLPADLTGASGQVMVEIAKFYKRQSYVGTTHTWEISLTPQVGFAVDPAFIKDTIEVPFRYASAYDACVVVGKLSSVSGAYPTTSQTRAQFRSAALARGAGWRQHDYFLASAIQLLALIEYGTFNIKGAIGSGRVNLSGGGWTNGSYLALSGLSNNLGNRTGAVQTGGTGGFLTDFMSYRGIENFWGHVWNFVDGLTVDATANTTTAPIPMWVTNNAAYFADTGSVGMVKLVDATNIGAVNEGYGATLTPGIAGFIPKTTGAGSTTKTCSYLWQYSSNAKGWRAPLLGGTADAGAVAGPLSFAVNSGAPLSYVSIGARAGF